MWTRYTDRVPCTVHHALYSPRPVGVHSPGCVDCHDPLAGTPDPANGSVPGGPGPGERKCSLTRYYGASCQAGRRHRTAIGSEVNLL